MTHYLVVIEPFCDTREQAEQRKTQLERLLKTLSILPDGQIMDIQLPKFIVLEAEVLARP